MVIFILVASYVCVHIVLFVLVPGCHFSFCPTWLFGMVARFPDHCLFNNIYIHRCFVKVLQNLCWKSACTSDIHGCVQLLIYPVIFRNKLTTLLVFNNRHRQEIDDWKNLFIYYVKYECKYLLCI